MLTTVEAISNCNLPTLLYRSTSFYNTELEKKLLSKFLGTTTTRHFITEDISLTTTTIHATSTLPFALVTMHQKPHFMVVITEKRRIHA